MAFMHNLNSEAVPGKPPNTIIRGFLGFLLIALLLQGGEGQLRAQDSKEQSAVIGFTLLGSHDFSKSDELRESAFVFDDTAGYGHLFAEYYPSEKLGFGYRYILIMLSEEITFTSGNNSAGFESELQITGNILTVQYLPFISDDGYTRIGFMAGGGPLKYEFTQTAGVWSDSVGTSGTGTLLGFYIDWGGDVFGARFGVGKLDTSFDQLGDPNTGTVEVDGSGTNFYLDLRWAFN